MTTDPTMTASQFQWHLQRLGITPYAAAPWLGISLRHVYRMLPTPKFPNGEYIVPLAVARLLRLMHRFDVKPTDI